MATTLRPTKKQQQLLEFIEKFIGENGYSPSYREIMVGCDYNSVATVAQHIQSLIVRGHLVKRGRSARSLEVVKVEIKQTHEVQVDEKDHKWLVKIIEAKFIEYEKEPDQTKLDELFVLVGALKVLGFEDAARSFVPRLTATQ